MILTWVSPVAVYTQIFPLPGPPGEVMETDFEPDAKHGSQGPNLQLGCSPRQRSVPVQK